MHTFNKFVFMGIIAGVLFFSCKKKTTEPKSSSAPVLKWKIEKIKTYNSPALGLDGTIYVFANDDTLYAVNPNGSIKWKVFIPDTGYGGLLHYYTSPVVGDNGTIYLQSSDGLYAVNVDGTVNWRYVLDSTFTSPNGTPALGIDGSIYACSGSYLYAIKSDGTLKWRTYILGAQAGMIPVVGGDGTIYVPASDGLYAVGHSNGIIKWYKNIPNMGASVAIGDAGVIYFLISEDLNNAGILYSIDLSGNINWSTTFKDSAFIPGFMAIGYQGTVYFGTSGGSFPPFYIYAAYGAGTVSPIFETSPFNVGALSIDSDGLIYWTRGAINPDTREEEWEYPVQIGATTSYGSPLILSDGTIYVATTSGLFAFEGNSSGLASTSWPRSHHDNRNTGRVNTQ